jgi:hypothetical protein
LLLKRKGIHVIGVIVGVLRQISGWDFVAIISEVILFAMFYWQYKSFAKERKRQTIRLVVEQSEISSVLYIRFHQRQFQLCNLAGLERFKQHLNAFHKTIRDRIQLGKLVDRLKFSLFQA